MRGHSVAPSRRLVCSIALVALLSSGPIGCDSGSDLPSHSTEIPPEVKAATNNMEEFVKQKQQSK